MKYFHIQIQPERCSSYKETKVESFLKNTGITPKITEGDDNGRYINFDFAVEEPGIFWGKLKAFILKGSIINNSSIVCCEGYSSWDDYYLLHHFDKDQQIDELS